VLFRRKEAYLGFATGTFVNRNTAATFWGSCALLFLVPLLRVIHRGDRSIVRPRINRSRDLGIICPGLRRWPGDLSSAP